MLNDHVDLDALIKAAEIHPTEEIRDKLIDLELDNNGNWVGYSMANYIWHRLIPSAA